MGPVTLQRMLSARMPAVRADRQFVRDLVVDRECPESDGLDVRAMAATNLPLAILAALVAIVICGWAIAA